VVEGEEEKDKEEEEEKEGSGHFREPVSQSIIRHPKP